MQPLLYVDYLDTAGRLLAGKQLYRTQRLDKCHIGILLCPATVQTSEVHGPIGRKCLCCEGVSTFVPGAMGMACWKAPGPSVGITSLC